MAQKNQAISKNTVLGLIREIRQIILSARTIAARSVDTIQVMTNYQIGHLIVEHEQHGARRATYGKEVLKELSGKLTGEFGRGFSEDNLSNMRKFYLVYHCQKRISETMSRKSLSPDKASDKLKFIPKKTEKTGDSYYFYH